ncbi:TonB-dependent receptor [Ichthyenterobacterium sp. W332]|uniref:TonB-dependent receptor n=1 Tax=Microcosmobacter mediterraneus TaxID=3075607 RepID=A0ABU2YFS0_9FLAO|nr:TonB-dependent receptor [Ichthyenterobacterium sp. W332]MDT0557034.1 TonB-dependent receptor [Ichthyenterobacterium sp. W332]
MKTIALIAALLFSSLISAQPLADSNIKNGSISGRVIDAKINEPLPYVNIIILNSAGETITGGITDDDGKFKVVDIPEGKVNVSITYIGYKTITRDVVIGKDSYNVKLGDINLEEDAEALDEVTVVAEVSTIQQKVDRKVINVGKDLTTSGPTASDIMNNLPSVSVDQQTGGISLRGNQNVQVMVDGKLSNIPAAQLLRQIPSTSIKKIELITNPSAKYNPEGLSGIINIILHKNTQIGFNGNTNVSLAYQDNPQFNGSIDMNYRNGKLNFYGNYNNSSITVENYGNLLRSDINSAQFFNSETSNISNLAKFGIDYYINDKNTLSVFTNQTFFDGGTDSRTNVVFANNIGNINQTAFNENKNLSGQYNFNYKLDFDKEGHNIELEVDYNIFDSESFTDNDFNIQPDFIEDNETDRDRTTINLDYVNPLSEKSKLELGLQARLFNNDITYFSDARLRDQFGNPFPGLIDFDYSRNIYSAYVTYGKTFEKWSYQLGLRAETVDVTADALQTNTDTNEAIAIPFENDYTQVYPSAFFTYNPSEKNSYQLSYSRRVDRPGVGQVNPLPEWNTPLISSFGNQELQPQFTNSLEVNYTRQLEKGSITGGVFYRIIEDGINRAVFIDPSTLGSEPELVGILLTFDNFDNTTAYGVEISSNYRPTKWWSINGSFDLYSQTQRSFSEVLSPNASNPTSQNDVTSAEFNVENVVWNLRMFNNFRVNKDLSFSVFGLYRGRNKGIQFTQDVFAFVNLGMRYNFLEDNRATFSLSFNDVFNTMQFRFDGDRPFPQSGDFNWESRTILAGLAYRFGGGKYRAKSRKQRDNDEKSGSGGFL